MQSNETYMHSNILDSLWRFKKKRKKYNVLLYMSIILNNKWHDLFAFKQEMVLIFDGQFFFYDWFVLILCQKSHILSLIPNKGYSFKSLFYFILFYFEFFLN